MISMFFRNAKILSIILTYTMDSSGDDFEDDPFNYQPLKRRKLVHHATPTAKRTSKAKTSGPSETQKPRGASKQVTIRPSSTQTQKKSIVSGAINNRHGKIGVSPKPGQVTRISQKPTQPLYCQNPSSQKVPKVKKTLKELLDSSEEKNEVPAVTRAGMDDDYNCVINENMMCRVSTVPATSCSVNRWWECQEKSPSRMWRQFDQV